MKKSILLSIILSSLVLVYSLQSNEIIYKKDNNIKIHLINKSILDLDVDAIINPANESLRHLGGLCGIIHKAAGPKLQEECLELPVFNYRGDPKLPPVFITKSGEVIEHKIMREVRCWPGEAKITKGYKLKAKNVIHAVGPDCRKKDQYKNRKKLLEDTYKNIIICAQENKLKSIAIPAISAGIFEFPIKEATEIAINTALLNLSSKENSIKDIYFVVMSKEHFDIYKTNLDNIFL